MFSAGVGVGFLKLLESESGVGVGFSKMLESGVGVGFLKLLESESVFQNCWSRSRNPKKSSDSTTLVHSLEFIKKIVDNISRHWVFFFVKTCL